MLRKLVLSATLLLAVPALANATWYMSASTSGSGTVSNPDVPTGAGLKAIPDTTLSETFTVTPAANYTISSVRVNGVAISPTAVGAATYRVNKSSTSQYLTAYFAQAKATVTPTVTGGGAVTPVTTLTAGSDYTVKISPNAGNVITKVVVDGVDKGVITTWTWPAITGAHTISATFAFAPTVTASVSANGSLVAGNAVILDGVASTNDTGFSGYSFLVNGSAAGVTQSPTSSTASFVPASPGTYTVNFTATTVRGGTGTATANVTIISAAAASVNSCTTCHSSRNAALITAYKASRHGVSEAATCDSCHKNTTVGHPGQLVTVGTCQSCHATVTNHAAVTLDKCLACHDPHSGAPVAGVTLTSAVAPDVYESGQVAPTVSKREGYAGAAACQACHAEQYSGWSKTFHNKPLKSLAAQGDVIIKNKADFVAGYVLKTAATANAIPAARIQDLTTAWEGIAEANAPKLSTDGTNYFIKIGNVTYQVFRTQGGNGKWKQRFHTKIGNAYYVLPVQFNEISLKYEAYNNGNWYNGSTPWINGGNAGAQFTNESAEVAAQVSSLLLARNVNGGATGSAAKGPSTSSWDNRCAACHQTGVAIEYKSVDGSSPMEVISSSADLNIGCESCHGPGLAHATAPSKENIKQPGKFATNVGSANYYRANEVCGQCHSRVEGYGHFSSASGKLYAGIEAPSPEVKDNGYGKVKAESYDVGQKILNFMEQIIPANYAANGSKVNGGVKIAYDDVPATASNAMVSFVAPDKHHQQWHDMELGKHGAIAQMSNNKGLTCFSCHDAHNPNSGNIKASIGGIATTSADNSLCLACHAGLSAVGTKDAAYTALDKADINNAANSNEEDAVYAHLVAAAGYPNDDLKKASWKAKYLLSVQSNGTTSATFGRAVYKVGQCISCHMPFTSKSGIYSATNANGRKQGDIRSHTMKPAWPKLSGNGLTNATVVTSCSACHAVPN